MIVLLMSQICLQCIKCIAEWSQHVAHGHRTTRLFTVETEKYFLLTVV